ncbi:MAG: hypothetical protein WC542_02955 [Paludibacter sp.]
MKKSIFILLAVATLFSCVENKKQLTGTWIEKDNFRNPKTFKYTENSFQVYEGKYLVEEKIFIIKKDTFITDNYKEIQKCKFILTGNILSFINLNNDSVMRSYEKGQFKNSLDYFNYKKKVNIIIPKQDSEEIRETEKVNSIYCDSSGNTYFNGEKVNIRDLASQFKSHSYSEIIYTLMYCDRNLSLSKLQEIKTQLIESKNYYVTYITLNKENQLEGVNVRLPPVVQSQSILDSIPQNNYENLICQITKDKIELNGKNVTSEQLFKTVKDKISEKKNELNIYAFFDNKLNYETYLKVIFNIRNAYYSVRKEYSKDKFGVSDYEFMDDSISNKIMDMYPMRVFEINENDYKRLKYAP